MSNERSVEFPQRQTDQGKELVNIQIFRESIVPCVNSRNMSRSASNFASGDLPDCAKGSAKRIDSSKTASAEREKVSH